MRTDRKQDRAGQGRGRRAKGRTPTTHEIDGHASVAVRALVGCPRVLNIYPKGHPRVEAQYDDLKRIFDGLFRAHPTPVSLTVRGMGVVVEDRALQAAPEINTGFALMLRRRQIYSLTLKPGLRRDEIARIVDLLGTDHKELLRAGGAQARLPESANPNIRLVMFKAGDGTERSGDAVKAVPAEVTQAIQDYLNSEEAAEAFERVRDKLRGMGADELDFEQLVSDFFGRPNWSDMPVDRVEQVARAFVERAEEMVNIASDDTNSSLLARIQSIKSFFQTATPVEDIQTEPDEVRVSYDPGKAENLLPEVLPEGVTAEDVIRDQLADHRDHDNSLLILCELMLSADDRHQYKLRRNGFLSSFRDRRYGAGAVARILRYIAVDLPPVQFESRDNLIQAVFDSTADEDALVEFLRGMTDQPDAMRPILHRFTARHNPFPLLVRLMQESELLSFHQTLTDKFLEAARLKPEAMTLWARKNRDTFFRPEVFEPLFSRGTELLGAICKEILATGSAKDQALLIKRLKDDGSETALRLLVLGMPYDTACDPQLLMAISKFRNPLAVAALREIVHRSNTSSVQPEEAGTALQALYSMGSEDGRAFLWEVLQSRRCLLPMYRRELRSMAAQVLEGKGIL